MSNSSRRSGSMRVNNRIGSGQFGCLPRHLRCSSGGNLLREKVALKRDVGTLTLRTGQITFVTPVLDRAGMAVFSGDGRLRFHSKPSFPLWRLST